MGRRGLGFAALGSPRPPAPLGTGHDRAATPPAATAPTTATAPATATALITRPPLPSRRDAPVWLVWQGLSCDERRTREGAAVRPPGGRASPGRGLVPVGTVRERAAVGHGPRGLQR